MQDREKVGAEIALAALRIASGMDQAEEALTVQYRDGHWDEATDVWVKDEEGHYVTWLDCSDTFFWGAGDAEELTEENFHIFEEVVAELKPLREAAVARVRGEEGKQLAAVRQEAYEKWVSEHPDDKSGWGKSPEFEALRENEIYPYRFAPVGDLFAARVRSMRPQGAAYKVRYDKSIWPLFDACGPEREIGMGNPRAIGD